jgi:hypothetical protein
MTSTQRNIVHVYNVFSVTGCVLLVVWMLKLLITKYFYRFIGGNPNSELNICPCIWSRKTSSVTLRSIGNARAYVPTLTRAQLHQCVICSDLSHIPAPYNYYTVKTNLDDEAVQFEPLSLAKLDLSIEVLAKVFDCCGKVSYYNKPAAANWDCEMEMDIF